MKYTFFTLVLLTTGITISSEKDIISEDDQISVPFISNLPYTKYGNNIDTLFTFAEDDLIDNDIPLFTIIQKLIYPFCMMNSDQFIDFMNMQFENGNTLLHEAAFRGDIWSINSLLQAYSAQKMFSSESTQLPNSLLEIRNAYDHTPFTLAVEHHQFGTADYLLQMGAYPNPYLPSVIPSYHKTTLLTAFLVSLLYKNDTLGAHYLLNNKHSSLKNTHKYLYAVSSSDANNIEKLIKAGIPEITSAPEGYDDIHFNDNKRFFLQPSDLLPHLRLITKKSTQFNTFINSKLAAQFLTLLPVTLSLYNTALTLCIENNNFETLKAILHTEKRFTLKECPQLLITALKKQLPTTHAITALLLEQGAPLHETDERGNSALHLAVQLKDDSFPVIRRLIHHKIPLNCINNDDKTALDLLIQQDDSCQKRVLRQYLSSHGCRTKRALSRIFEKSLIFSSQKK
ncbi:MAG: hypothetical protein M1114_04340 [Candidatus Dependentiae bacterium]|nr:hypothetical protein [Candidatus Dependentiae bacterium]